ncbi:MAG: hypothetical protein H0X37_18260 [Herpetosiphonaceae bacterium]|nr:hypothetical protein [Herpetosiphonaceae bacterium]
MPSRAAAEPFDALAFRTAWQQADQLVQAGQVNRTWLWGPAAGFSVNEPYVEANGGKRLVQYFDKSRMELTDPSRSLEDPWRVTNGLIVREMVTGQIQTGDTQFVAKERPMIPVAGDLINNPTAATYANFGRFEPSLVDGTHESKLLGQPVTSVWYSEAGGGVNRSLGTQYPETANTAYDDVTGHNLPGVFWRYFSQAGDIIERGQRVRSQPLFDWLYVAGHPITAAYWTKAVVGGHERDVLVQLFERRVLTYTPSNVLAWQVEMGNVGQHYANWRYGKTVSERSIDCSMVEQVAPDSPDGHTISTQLLADLSTLPQIGTPLQFASVVSIDRDSGWVLVQASFKGNAEPGIFALQKTSNGYHYVTAWSGVTDRADTIRSYLAAHIPGAPGALTACLAPSGFVDPASAH